MRSQVSKSHDLIRESSRGQDGTMERLMEMVVVMGNSKDETVLVSLKEVGKQRTLIQCEVSSWE